MNLPLGSKTCIPAMAFLWTYAVFKFLVGFNVLRAYGINPWIFLFLDTVTVPTYIIGWSRLIALLGPEPYLAPAVLVIRKLFRCPRTEWFCFFRS